MDILYIINFSEIIYFFKGERRDSGWQLTRKHLCGPLSTTLINSYTISSYFCFIAYNMVACRITDARNGGQISNVRQIPLSK